MPEQVIVEKAMRLLRVNRCRVIKTHGSGMQSGEPDLIGVIGPWGFHFVIEMKRPGEVPTAQQRIRLLEYARHGSIAFAADSAEYAVTTVIQGEVEILLAIRGNTPWNAVQFCRDHMLQKDRSLPTG